MPDPPFRIAALMRDFEPHWFVAGGWALDLYLGRLTRTRDDIEIAVFRRDQLALQKYLDGCNLQKVVNGESSVWRRNEFLEPPVHEIHCFKSAPAPIRFEILLNEANESEWIFRRDENVRLKLDKSYLISSAGIGFLAPEIVLLYKSKNPRAKDEKDFQTVIIHLEKERRRWLKKALNVCYRQGHRWTLLL